MQNPSFKIYNASAGSGKTFNLVREYLKKVFLSNSKLAFRQILALTFTNKAVGEMKERVIKTLKEFSNEKILQEPSDMFNILKEDLNCSSDALHEKSKVILKTILHNYAAFDISTIDKFNHRLIRTFTNDLKLPANFEVELDTDSILAKAVDRLINKAGTEKEITDLLINFSMQKMDEDKSWDVSYDLINIAKILKDDEHKVYVDKLKSKSLDDYQGLKKNLKIQINKIEDYLKENARKTLFSLQENDLLEGVFNRNTLPNHFIKIENLDFVRLYGNQLGQNLENNSGLYNIKKQAEKAQIIESLIPQLRETYFLLKIKVHELLFLKNALKHIVPLSVLHEINLCLKEITNEEGLVLISDFNSIINNEIKNHPAPYIYERLGDRYRDYFIDEFQDTSVLQWNNLKPLIDNSLAQESLDGKRGSSMIVGDAKQSIYRWRGGEPEQFINLYEKIDSPFSIEAVVTSLENNYRSKQAIVNFNNSFFKFISETVFSTRLHSKLFESSKQLTHNVNEGYVQIQFLEKDVEDKDLEFCQHTLQIIRDAQKDGFRLNDICILTRRNKDGATIANYLSDNGIRIISSESLLLSNSPKVDFIISILTVIENAENLEAKVKALGYLYKQIPGIEDEHNFYTSTLTKENSEFFNRISSFGYNFSISSIVNVPLYELVEIIIRSFDLNHRSDAYLQFLMDEIFQFTQKFNLGIREFLEYWNLKQDKLSVVNPDGDNAVRIMTIHRSKGLEFPIVIFPYASHKIYDDRSPKAWFPVDPNKFSGFEFLFVNNNKDLQEYNEVGKDIYNNHRSRLELDSINLLYVTLTRPIDRLYILSENDATKSDGLNKYSELFIEYLRLNNLYEENTRLYELGDKAIRGNTSESLTSLDTIGFISTSREKINLNILTNEGRLWDTNRKEALEKGNLLHHALSLISYSEDVAHVFTTLENDGSISQTQSQILKAEVNSIINNKTLNDYYSKNWTIINEREIITETGDIHKPDRIMVNREKEAVILDYKTGRSETRHEEQIIKYGQLLVEMGYTVLKKYLVYVGSEIEILEI